MNTRRIGGITLAAGLWLGACTPVEDQSLPQPIELDRALITQTITQRISEHLHGVAGAVKSLEASQLLNSMLEGEEGSNCPEGEICDEGAAGTFDFSEQVDAATEWLEANVINDAFIESSTATSVTYRLSADKFCVGEDEEGNSTRSEDCDELFAELPVRLVVTSLNEGDLDIEVKVGTQSPVSFELYAAHLGTQVDLAAAKSVVESAADILDEELQGVPERFSGKFSLKAIRNGADDYTASLSILQLLNVGVNAPSSLEYFDARIAPATDALSLRVKGGEAVVAAKLGFEKVDIAAALNLIAGESAGTNCEWDPETESENCTEEPATEYEGVLSLALAALSGEANFDANTDSGSVAGFGFGSEKAVIALDGAQILSALVNDGSTFSAAFSSDTERFEIAPGLKLVVEHSLAALGTAMGEELPEFVTSGSSTIEAVGAPKVIFGIETIETQECDAEGSFCESTFEDRLELIEGSISFSATGVEAREFEAGECIALGEPEGEDAHLFEGLSAVACE